MNTDYYKIFLKVIETGNISKAAQQLGYTQSGVSHIISKMEKEFQLPLLNRERSGITPTDASQALLPLMETIVSAEEQLHQAAEDQRLAQRTNIRIGTSHTIAISWLGKLMRDYMADGSTVKFEVIEKSKYPAMKEALLKQEVDLFFTVELEDPQITFLPLFEDEYFVILPKGHPLGEFETLSPQQLKGYPFVFPEEGVNHKGILEIAQSLDRKKNLRTETLDDFMTISLVRQGWGISIVPGMFLQNSEDDLLIRKLEGSFCRRMGLNLLQKDEPVNHALKQFVDFVPGWFANHTAR